MHYFEIVECVNLREKKSLSQVIVGFKSNVGIQTNKSQQEEFRLGK